MLYGTVFCYLSIHKENIFLVADSVFLSAAFNSRIPIISSVYQFYLQIRDTSRLLLNVIKADLMENIVIEAIVEENIRHFACAVNDEKYVASMYFVVEKYGYKQCVFMNQSFFLMSVLL